MLIGLAPSFALPRFVLMYGADNLDLHPPRPSVHELLLDRIRVNDLHISPMRQPDEVDEYQILIHFVEPLNRAGANVAVYCDARARVSGIVDRSLDYPRCRPLPHVDRPSKVDIGDDLRFPFIAPGRAPEIALVYLRGTLDSEVGDIFVWIAGGGDAVLRADKYTVGIVAAVALHALESPLMSERIDEGGPDIGGVGGCDEADGEGDCGDPFLHKYLLSDRLSTGNAIYGIGNRISSTNIELDPPPVAEIVTVCEPAVTGWLNCSHVAVDAGTQLTGVSLSICTVHVAGMLTPNTHNVNVPAVDVMDLVSVPELLRYSLAATGVE